MDVGMIVFWVFFSICAAIVAIGWLSFLAPVMFCIPAELWRLLRMPRCLYFFTPEEFKADSKKAYNDYDYYESRYVCVCDRSVCLYQMWHLKNRIVNKLRSQIHGITRLSSSKQSDDVLPVSQRSIPLDEPLSSSSSVPKNPYSTLTMDHGINWASSSSETENNVDTVAQR